MTKICDAAWRDDLLDLDRFTIAQEKIYNNVQAELGSGCKRSHWMWYIFPQLDGLAHSETSKYFAIKSIEEARQYLAHPVIGPKLLECS